MKLTNKLLFLLALPVLSTAMQLPDESFFDALPQLVDTELEHYTPAAVSLVPSNSSFDEVSATLSPRVDGPTPEQPKNRLPLSLPPSDATIHTCNYLGCGKQFEKESSYRMHMLTVHRKKRKSGPANPKRPIADLVDQSPTKKTALVLQCPFTACAYKTQSQLEFDTHCDDHKAALAARFNRLLAAFGSTYKSSKN